MNAPAHGQRRRWPILVLILIGLLIPFPTEMVPEWTMRFTDESGAPLSNVVVEQGWESYTYFVGRGYEQECTDREGTVQFPTRYLWSSVFGRLISPPLAELGTLAHGSTGTDSTVRVFDRNYISDSYYFREKMELYSAFPGTLPTDGKANKVDRNDIDTCMGLGLLK